MLNLKTTIRDYLVSTIDLEFEHIGGRYETAIYPIVDRRPSFGEVWRRRYATEEEAEKGHAEVCRRVEAGELP